VQHDLASWARTLRRRAEERLALTQGRPPPRGVARGFGTWRDTVGRPAGASPSSAPTTPVPSHIAPPHSLDDALWLALTSPEGPIPPLLAPERADAPAPLSDPVGMRGVEVWTETELSAMHALWWLARRSGDPERLRRLDLSATWMLEHMQPDNATNRPWAICVFLDLWRREDNHDASLYAQTLLHNAEIGADLDDPLVALILADNADALDAMLRDG